jgi:hypothetical protein
VMISLHVRRERTGQTPIASPTILEPGGAVTDANVEPQRRRS